MQLDRIIIIGIVATITLIWYMRPLYNFMAIRKYVLLDRKNLTTWKKIQSGLPALLFYILILGVIFYPAITNRVINGVEGGSVIAIEIIIIFLVTRYDKFQSKYTISKNQLTFRKKNIDLEKVYAIKFKKSFLVVLHKPRFIFKQKGQKVVVSLYSKNIHNLINTLTKLNDPNIKYISKIYENTKAYYIENKKLSAQLNK